MTLEDIKDIEQQAQKDIEQLDNKTLKEKYLSKQGIIKTALKQLKDLPPDERPNVGKRLNIIKAQIEEKLKSSEQQYEEKHIAEDYDITLPGRLTKGGIHPINLVMQEIVNIFVNLGYSIAQGPEIESDYYNFQALNFPDNHPARDMQDTLYLENDYLLRTHTSPVQIRTMEQYKPPIAVIIPGRVYRRDDDISHSPMFHQLEGLLVDKHITFQDLKGTIIYFVKQFFGDIDVRFRPSFFPFTEPSAEIDIQCIFCKGKGCRTCGQTGWLEVGGCGMVDPNLYDFVDYDKQQYTGFAFGMGIDRLTMLKFGINDLRLFFDNDLRFLKQFGV